MTPKELARLSATLSTERILKERQKKALKRVKVKGKITNKEYVDLNKVSRITATRELMDMVRRKILKQEGRGER